MLKTYRLSALAGVFAALMAGTAHAEVMTLNDALAAAYEGNPQLGAARASVRATDEGVAQANAGWRPQISATGQYGIQHENFTKQQSIFGPGSNSINERDRKSVV